MIDRREFARLLGGAALVAAGPALIVRPALAKGGAKVVIVGGGAGGGTVARILKTEAPELDVTVVEARPSTRRASTPIISSAASAPSRRCSTATTA